MRKTRLASSAILLFAALAATADAQVQYLAFDDDRFSPTNSRAAQSAFLASLLDHGTETFAGDIYLSPQPLVFGGFGTGQIDDPTFYPGFNTISNFVGLEGANGYVTAFGGTSAAPISFSFSGQTVGGFGFFLSGTNDIGAGLPTVTLDFLSGGSSVFSWQIDNVTDLPNNTMFVGLSGISFDQVDVRGQDGDGVWVNEVTIGSQALRDVPEPASLALLLGSLVSAAFVVRQRRRS